jgi:hypothetical protein
MSYMNYKQVIFCVFWVTLLAACTTPKKLNKVMNKLPEAAAKECAVRFPIKETIDTITVLDTALLRAYEMEFGYLYSIVDSLLGQQVHDSVKREIVTIFQEKKVPVIKYKYITKTQENTAKCQVKIDSLNKIKNQLELSLNKKTKESDTYLTKYTEQKDKADKYKSQRNSLYWWLLLLLVLLFRKPILAVIRKLVIKS